MRRPVIVVVTCLLGSLTSSCYQWPDGSAIEGDPGTHGIPAPGDPGGRSPVAKLDHERNPRERGPKHGLHDTEAAPAVAISAGSGPTLDTEDAAKAQGREGPGVSGSGTADGTTSSGTGSATTTGGGTTGSGATTGGGTTGSGAPTGGTTGGGPR